MYVLVEPKVTDKNVLNVLKFERLHSERLSNEITSDARATKKMLETMSLSLEDDSFRGYIQEIHQDPFGLTLVSDIQVRFTTIDSNILITL